MRRRWVIAAISALLLVPPEAEAATTTSISLYSDPGDFIGQGQQRVFHPGNASEIGASMEGRSVLAWAIGGPYDEGYSFQFEAPDGRALAPGSYVGAQRLPFKDPDRPGMEVVGESRGCNEIFGSFEVRQLERDAQGRVQRLWVVFQQHCEGDQDTAWGEVRINAWVPDAQALTAPGSVRWTGLDSWQTATEVPVIYRGAAPVRSVALTGANPGDFALAPAGCQGRGGPCEVRVRFRPQAAGVRSAAVRFTDVSGGVHETALEGFAYGGTTEAVIEVLAGDVAGQPGTYRYGHARRALRRAHVRHRDGPVPARGRRELVRRPLRRRRGDAAHPRATTPARGPTSARGRGSACPAPRRAAPAPAGRSACTRSAACPTAACAPSTSASRTSATPTTGRR